MMWSCSVYRIEGVVVACVVIGSCSGAMGQIECAFQDTDLLPAVIAHVIEDSVVRADLGGGDCLDDYYVFPYDDSRSGGGVWRYELFEILYGRKFSWENEESRDLMKSLSYKDSISYHSPVLLYDSCLAAIGADTTSKLVMYFYQYNDSILMVDVENNKNWSGFRNGAGGETRHLVDRTPVHFLFKHEEGRILERYRRGPMYR